MKEKINKYFLLLIAVVVLFVPFQSDNTVQAASGYQGYAVYRDGVFFNTTWHAGIYIQPSSSHYSPIVHAAGGTSKVSEDSLESFLDGENYKGVYKPNNSPTSSYRDLYVAMARNLASQNISYNLAYQVYYNTSTASTYVQPNEVSSMRCDGVVEYIYEFYSARVYGSDAQWDVTRNDSSIRNHHSGIAITPRSQINYLTEL